MQAKLPNFFSFETAKDLIRIGKQNDGGYLVSKSDIHNSDCLIGLEFQTIGVLKVILLKLTILQFLHTMHL